MASRIFSFIAVLFVSGLFLTCGNLATNSVPAAPTITTQPQSKTVTAGQSVTFTVMATGTVPLSFQWCKDGAAIPGATSSSYSLPNVQAANAGTYTVIVSNGTLPDATSNGAALAVSAEPAAPSIATQPQSQTVTAGQSVTFSVTAMGTAPLSYQWCKDGTPISGATSSSYSLSNIQAANAGTYTVIVSNGALPNATTNGAVLTVSAEPVAPSITTQPQSQFVTAGQSVTFSVTATGTAPLSYQWYKGGTPISGATSSSYSLSNVQAANAGTYTVIVSSGNFNLPYATSNGAVLTVSASPVAPGITTQPQSQTVTAGGSVTFSVTATGTIPLSYQWYKDGAAISGATSSSYTLSNVQTANAGTYIVTVSNGALPNATTNGAVLAVNPASVAPNITMQPQSEIVTAGQSVMLSVTATGTAPLSYQWYKDGAAISGATLSSYSISNVQAADMGTYTVTASNGTVPNATSNGAALTVNPSQDSVIDIDGNVYYTVTIGTQVWTIENLRTTRYNDGAAIPLVTDSAAWGALTTPGYCWYNNNLASNKITYGALYNWYAVNTGKLAPKGWHMPTDAEWSILTAYLGGETMAGGLLKEAGTTHWLFPNAGATNETGFSALPGGSRESNGHFADAGSYGWWWSATDANATLSYSRFLYYFNGYLNSNVNDKSCGFSVRLVRN